MTTILFYEKPGCVNNARQKKLLREAGHELVVRNLLETVWSPDELRAFFGGRPVPEWFNRAAPRIKSGEVVPETLDETRALALMVDDPLLIRRPLLQVGARREAGFDLERIQEWLGALEATESEGDLESCRRSQPCTAP